MNAKIRFMFSEDYSGCCMGNGCEEGRAKGEMPGEDLCLSEGRMINELSLAHDDNDRRVADIFWK